MNHSKSTTTHFVVITTCYNVMPWITTNLENSKQQTHKSVLFVYVDDGSTDGTYEFLHKETKGDPRFLVLRAEDPSLRGSQGKAFLYAWNHLRREYIQPEDVIVEVDGDDWLYSNQSLALVDQLYQDPNVWMTYGNYIKYPDLAVGGHYNMEIPDLVDWDNDYRSHPFPFSHLKTYKAKLLARVDPKDLLDPRTNQPFAEAWDHALCLPMVEMAGKARIAKSAEILYVLNRSANLANEGSTRLTQQKQTESVIRSMPKYSRL